MICSALLRPALFPHSTLYLSLTAHEVGAVAMAVADSSRDFEQMFESIRQMERRLNRVVGVTEADG